MRESERSESGRTGYDGDRPAERANASAATGPAGVSTVPAPAAAHAQQTRSQAAFSASAAFPQMTHTRAAGACGW